jgi:hypothetical protein
MSRIDTVNAIMILAPLFLEEVFLESSEMPEWALRTIPALGILNTGRIRKRLAESA